VILPDSIFLYTLFGDIGYKVLEMFQMVAWNKSKEN
jgi:hypothetical protein